MIFMIIYIYSYVYLCIYTPSYQHFKAFAIAVSKFDSESTFLYQLFNKNLKFTVYKPFNMFLQVYMYIYIQYQINILKPLQCPQLQRAQGYVQLAPARKLAWVFLFWLALAQVSRFWHVLRGWSGKNTSQAWQASMQVFLWWVARWVNDATLTRQIDNSRMKLARVC